MKSFYIYSTVCAPKEDAEVPYIRGRGRKTYLHYSENLNSLTTALAEIPEYEQVITTRIYHNEFPASHDFSPRKIVSLFENCTRCTLSHYRWKTVHMRGHVGAKIIMVGQSPGHNEDEQGVPFVGASGSLLAEMLSEAKFKCQFLLTNIVACRPDSGPGCAPRSDPRPEECVACSQRLWLLLTSVKPNVILALGQIPAKMFWKKPKDKSMNKLYRLSDKLFIGQTRHPAYHLRKMANGGSYEMDEAVEFFTKLNKFIPSLESFKKGEKWALNDNRYPFSYVSKEVKC